MSTESMNHRNGVIISFGNSFIKVNFNDNNREYKFYAQSNYEPYGPPEPEDLYNDLIEDLIEDIEYGLNQEETADDEVKEDAKRMLQAFYDYTGENRELEECKHLDGPILI